MSTLSTTTADGAAGPPPGRSLLFATVELKRPTLPPGPAASGSERPCIRGRLSYGLRCAEPRATGHRRPAPSAPRPRGARAHRPGRAGGGLPLPARALLLAASGQQGAGRGATALPGLAGATARHARDRLASERSSGASRSRCSRSRSDFSSRMVRPPDPTEYWAENDQYPALDAWVLEGMLRHLRPAPDDRDRIRVLVARHREGQSRAARRRRCASRASSPTRASS